MILHGFPLVASASPAPFVHLIPHPANTTEVLSSAMRHAISNRVQIASSPEKVNPCGATTKCQLHSEKPLNHQRVRTETVDLSIPDLDAVPLLKGDL
jgi:hypothetical protein